MCRITKFSSVLFAFIGLCFLTGCGEGLYFSSDSSYDKLLEESGYGIVLMEFEDLEGTEIRSFESVVNQEYIFEITSTNIVGSIKVQFEDSLNNVIEEVIITGKDIDEEDLKLKQAQNMDEDTIETIKKVVLDSPDLKIQIVITGDNASGRLEITWDAKGQS